MQHMSETVREADKPYGQGAARRPMKVSIVIPVYNEEATVQQLVGFVVSRASAGGRVA